MSSDLKILILEDNPADAELVQRALHRAGIQCQAVVATDENDFLEALQSNGYHAVLSDNALPQYSSLEALKMVKTANPYAAFILVTGTVSEEFAVSIIKQGADDYILKTNLTRLPSALLNAIEKKRVQQEVEQERNLSVQIINSLPGLFFMYDKKGHFVRWNKNFEKITGYTAEEVRLMGPADFFELEPGQDRHEWLDKIFERGYSENEVVLVTSSEFRIPYLLTCTTIDYDGKTCILGAGLDISSGKKSEKELKQANTQLRYLSQRLHSIREEEQRRIARELHDELGQQITGVKMDIFTLKNAINARKPATLLHSQIEEINHLLDNAVKAIRKISSELHPSILDDLGLVAALEWQTEEFRRRFLIEIDFYASEEAKALRLDLDTATGLFRMFQESLTNIARHAGPCTAHTSLVLKENMLVLTVADTGKGFDNSIKTGRKTLGLVGLRERALMIGASVTIESAAAKGTLVQISVLAKKQ